LLRKVHPEEQGLESHDDRRRTGAASDRRLKKRLRFVALLLALAFAGCPAPDVRAREGDGARPSRRPEGGARVAETATIALEVRPARAVYVTGESFDVVVRLTNGGADPVDVPSPERERPFELQLRLTNDEEREYAFSRVKRSIARTTQPGKRGP